MYQPNRMPSSRAPREALAAVLLTGLVLGCGSAPAPSQGAAPNSPSPALEVRFQEALRDKEARPRPEPVDEMRTAMDEYRAKYDADPTGPEAPILLNAMANIAQQRFGDDARAIEYYETLVLNFPDWEGTPAVYPLLAAAYDRTERFEDARWLYEQMMKRFPPVAPEFQYAREKLGLKPLPEETAPPEGTAEEQPEPAPAPASLPVAQVPGGMPATGS